MWGGKERAGGRVVCRDGAVATAHPPIPPTPSNPPSTPSNPRTQRATDVVRKLMYGDVDLGIVGADMLAEIGNNDPGTRARVCVCACVRTLVARMPTPAHVLEG